MLGNEVANIISNGVLSILGALASYGVTVGVSYLKKKKEVLIKQVGVDQYNYANRSANINISDYLAAEKRVMTLLYTQK